MAIRTGSYSVGVQCGFFREGDTFTIDTSGGTVSATPASRTAKPGAADTGWKDIGIVGSAKDVVTGDMKEIWAPSPGLKQLYDILRLKPKRVTKVKLEQVSALAIQAYYLTQNLSDASTQMNILSGDLMRGWLKMQRYDQKNREFFHDDTYGVFLATGEVDYSADEIIGVEFDFVQLQSPLNTSSVVFTP